MDGGIVDNNVCQLWWRLLVNQPVPRYCSPQWAVGQRFVKYIAEEFPEAKKVTLERGVAHGIHGGDSADDTGGMQCPHYSPQDHAVLRYVIYWAVCHYVHSYHNREAITDNNNYPRQ